MITSEKLLKIISLLILSATVVFSIITVGQELLKPKEKLDRIISDQCDNSYKVVESNVESESGFDAIENNCIFIPSEKLNGSPFLKSISLMGNLHKSDYLFIGQKGVLIQKVPSDNKSAAQKIINCIRKNECSGPDTDSKYTITLLFKNSEGKTEASVSYVDTQLSQITKNSKKLLTDIVKLKNIDINNLRLLLYFHSKYTFIENKTPEYAVSLMKKGVDGLYLESRGAKIRVLPDEYQNNPFDLLDKKGRQYGLEKDEYKKGEASIFIYRTVQFIEHNGEMIPFSGNSTLNKTGYSDRISALFISKHLKNIQESSGKFTSGLEIFSGKPTDEKDSLVSQAYAAMALFKVSTPLKDPSLSDAAVRSFNFIEGSDNKSDEIKALIILLNSLCKEKCSEKQEAVAKYLKEFRNIEKIIELIDNNPSFTGIFINTALTANKDADIEIKLAGALKRSAGKFEKMKPEDKIRFISSICEIDPSGFPILGEAVRSFLKDRETYLNSLRFDYRNFDDFRGGISIKAITEKPDTALSILLANGLSASDINGTATDKTSRMANEMGNFIKHMIVTDDDFPVWGSTTSKPKVQGGVRAFPGSSNIRLFNSARALNYFSNLIATKREL